MMFLSPLFLGAMALAAAPVIIHLLNRRRFRQVEWAPMRYLKLTVKNNRRRLRLEQLILLAIRTLVVAMLVLAVARPVLSSTGFGQMFGGAARVSRLVVIDDSLSMGYVNDGVTAFDAAKSVAAQLVKSAAPQDTLTVVVASAMDAPLVREARTQDSAKLLEELSRLRPSDAANNWTATFKIADEYLRSSTFPTRQLVVLTDLRQSGWDRGAGEWARGWASQGVGMRLIDVGARQTANTHVPSLQLEDPAALVQTSAKVRGAVRNAQTTPLVGGQAVWQVAGQERPVLLPEIPPGQSAPIPLTFTSATAGPTALRLAAPADALPADDVRWLCVNVRPNLKLSLIDGEPGARPFESETDFLALALSVGAIPWEVNRTSEVDWSIGQPPPDVLMLANVASLSPRQVESLESQVRAGMGLMIFCGDLIDPQLYNERLYKNGTGLLPTPLVGPVDGPAAGLALTPMEQSPLDALAQISPEALARVSARRLMSVEPPAAQAGQVRVLARWNDADGRPAVLEKRLGKGRVVLWTMTADRAWSDWPIDPTYVLGVRSAAMALARPDRADANIIAGQPIHFALEAGTRVLEPRILPPGAETPLPLALESPDGPTPELRYGRTARAGVYRLTWKDAAGREQFQLVCANPDVAESNLEPISDEQLRSVLQDAELSIIHYSGANIAADAKGREIWRSLAVAVLVLAAVETALAVWVGRER